MPRRRRRKRGRSRPRQELQEYSEGRVDTALTTAHEDCPGPWPASGELGAQEAWGPLGWGATEGKSTATDHPGSRDGRHMGHVTCRCDGVWEPVSLTSTGPSALTPSSSSTAGNLVGRKRGARLQRPPSELPSHRVTRKTCLFQQSV